MWFVKLNTTRYIKIYLKGDMASTIQACVEDAAGVSLDVILGGSLLNARKRSRTGGAVRDENVEMLRKQAREKMLQRFGLDHFSIKQTSCLHIILTDLKTALITS